MIVGIVMTCIPLACVQSASEEVVKFLQNLCSNNIDVDAGTIVHTGMHNECGGFENDATIARLHNNRQER